MNVYTEFYNFTDKINHLVVIQQIGLANLADVILSQTWVIKLLLLMKYAISNNERQKFIKQAKKCILKERKLKRM